MVINIYEKPIALELRQEGMKEAVRSFYYAPYKIVEVYNPISTEERME